MYLENETSAAPVVETGNGAGQQITLAGVLLSEKDCTTGWSTSQGISALLLPGEENAIPLRHLVKITGLEEREVRRAVQRERRAGVPILANYRTGFYLPATDAERSRWVRSMLHRSAEIAKAALAVEKGAGC